MVNEEDVIFIHESIIQGHHMYKDIWTPMKGDILEVQREPENEYYHRAVCLIKSGTIIDHVPRELSTLFWFFLGCCSGKISCEVTGRRKHDKGQEDWKIFMASHPIVGFALSTISISCLTIHVLIYST